LWYLDCYRHQSVRREGRTKQFIPILFFSSLTACGTGSTDEHDAGPDASPDAGDDAGTDDECVPDDTFDPEDCPDVSDINDCVVYVDADATTEGDGRSWANALPDLQDGLDLATCGVLTTDYCQSWQVWAAEGSYYAWRVCELDTYWVRDNVHLYGGFAGDEAALSEREPETHVTTLDGHDGPDGEQHVWNVTVVPSQADVVLDGLTITGGGAEPEEQLVGGGLWSIESNLSINGCTFENNSAEWGGGIYLYDATVEITNSSFRENAAYTGGGMTVGYSSLTMENCLFEGNSATADGFSAGLHISSGTVAELTDCTFLDNQGNGTLGVIEAIVEMESCHFEGNEGATIGALASQLSTLTINDSTFVDNAASEPSGHAGALFSDHGSLDLTDSSFEGNSAGLEGGALFAQLGSSITASGCRFFANTSNNGGGAVLVANESVVVSECLFVDNSATEEAGALGLGMNEESSVSHCTFAGNSCETGGSAIGIMDEQLVLIDSILWDETAPEIFLITEETPDPMVTYSDVRGGWAGEGNIDADPLFVDPDGGDYCLQDGSPCIGAASDAGDMGYCPYEGK